MTNAKERGILGMRKRRIRTPRWAVVAILASAVLSAFGTAGFGYIGSGGRWGGHYSPLSYNH